MKNRKLRIAWSVAWGLVAVALLAFWVRSYFVAGGLFLRNNAGQSFVGATTGIFEISSASRQFINPSHPGDTEGWIYQPNNPTVFQESTLLHFHSVNRRNPNLFIVEFPGWVPIVVCFVLATASYCGQLRFSLRTLLIATTLLAVGLGIVVWLSH